MQAEVAAGDHEIGRECDNRGNEGVEFNASGLDTCGYIPQPDRLPPAREEPPVRQRTESGSLPHQVPNEHAENTGTPKASTAKEPRP
jgi:hypothetical protein